jgi:type I restriction enzyme, S subunit
MKTTAPNSENLEVRSEKRDQDSSFSFPSSHFSLQPPALVPKLRFPEFQNAVEWENKPLSTCLDYQQPTPYLVSGTNYSPAFKTPVLTAGKTFILGYTDEEHGIFSQDLPVIIFDDFTTATQFVDFPFKAKSSAMKILQAQNGANIKFMFETLQTLSYEVGAHERHWISNFAPMLVPVPKPPEQQKIAECLSSVDELMAAQARKVDALKTHKKGLMQQLFPREGETQPRLRFREFRNEGELQKTTIGDLKPFVTSGSRGWAAFYADQGELFVRITNLWRDSIYLDLTDSKFVQLPPGANEGVRTQLKEHDVLISITADIGIIGYVDESVPSPAYINQHIALVRFDERQLCGKYVAYFLASQESQRVFRASTDNGAKAGMNLIGIQKIGLMLPSLPEQQRIASCLSSLDALITAETQKHEGIKTHKKGLMQQLFPSPEEVES